MKITHRLIALFLIASGLLLNGCSSGSSKSATPSPASVSPSPTVSPAPVATTASPAPTEVPLPALAPREPTRIKEWKRVELGSAAVDMPASAVLEQPKGIPMWNFDSIYLRLRYQRINKNEELVAMGDREAMMYLAKELYGEFKVVEEYSGKNFSFIGVEAEIPVAEQSGTAKSKSSAEVIRNVQTRIISTPDYILIASTGTIFTPPVGITEAQRRFLQSAIDIK